MNKNTLQPANFGERFLAFFIDNILLSIAIAPILLTIFGRKTFTEEQMQTILQSQGVLGLFTPGEIIISNLIGFAVTAFLWVRFAGTPMKRILGLRVVDAKTGNNVTPSQAALRYLCYFISYFPMCLGFIWMVFDKDKQTWHDKLSGTRVVKDKPSPHRQNNAGHQSAISKDSDDTFTA